SRAFSALGMNRITWVTTVGADYWRLIPIIGEVYSNYRAVYMWRSAAFECTIARRLAELSWLRRGPSLRRLDVKQRDRSGRSSRHDYRIAVDIPFATFAEIGTNLKKVVLARSSPDECGLQSTR